MDDADRKRWLAPALIVAVLYVVASLGTAELANRAASHPMQVFWRWSAFVVAGMLFLVQVVYEHFKFRNRARSVASHTGAAAACAGLGIAIAANLHELGRASGYRPRMVLALVLWPLIAGVPVFIAALVLAAGLETIRKRGPASAPH